jgi:hypothetical protein
MTIQSNASSVCLAQSARPTKTTEAQYLEFKSELTKLINRCAMENGSNTPDFLLAEYLVAHLRAFDNFTALRARCLVK